jgi:hypothetical protein
MDHHGVINNVCIHLANDQPLIADLFDLPQASDAGLVCTNVRTLDGKRPVFIDNTTATFFFPYHIVRFLEIPEGAAGFRRPADGADGPGSAAGPGRGSGADRANRLPVLVSAPGGGVDGDPEADLEIDEDFLQRIRDI